LLKDLIEKAFQIWSRDSTNVLHQTWTKKWVNYRLTPTITTTKIKYFNLSDCLSKFSKSSATYNTLMMFNRSPKGLFTGNLFTLFIFQIYLSKCRKKIKFRLVLKEYWHCCDCDTIDLKAQKKILTTSAIIEYTSILAKKPNNREYMLHTTSINIVMKTRGKTNKSLFFPNI
jgi:hypothetical protein